MLLLKRTVQDTCSQLMGGARGYMRVLLLIVVALEVGAVDTLDVNLQAGWNLLGIPGVISGQGVLALNPALSRVVAYRNDALVDVGTESVPLPQGQAVAVQTSAAVTIKLPLPAGDRSAAPVRSDLLSVAQGVSVLTLPVNMMVSPRLFGDRAVLTWENGGWRAYPNAAAQRYGYGDLPPVFRLNPGQGFVVVGDMPAKDGLNDLASELKPFSNDNEMIAYLREQALSQRSYGAAVATPTEVQPNASGVCDRPYLYPVLTVGATATTTSSVTTNATTTNVQEKGVGESDFLQHNDRDVFYTTPYTQHILVSSFDTFSRNAKPLGEIAFGKCVNVEAMYLQNDRLIVVQGSGQDYWGSWRYFSYGTWNQGSTIDVYDVSDALHAKKISSQKLDGAVVNSRLLGDRLYLIMRYVPYFEVDYPQATSKSCASATALCTYTDYNNPIIKNERVLPYLTDLLTGTKTQLFQSGKFYAPAKLDQYTNTVSVLAFDAKTGQLADKVGIFGSQDTVYMSTQNLYLVSADYPRYFAWTIAADNETRSKINRFSVGASLDYTGSVFVDGTVLNQFSLSEDANQVLRVATTRRFWNQDWRSNTDNQVATFSGARNALKQIGLLGGLGKAGETLRGARFMGSKGYLNTFRNTDPFYTVDLSNPAAPRKVGELSIPGFSTYLQAIDDNRVLSIGRDASDAGTTKGVLLQLFDVSDFANPKLADKRIYGTDSNTRSSAEQDAKAFTYRADGLLAFDLLTSSCGYTSGGSAASSSSVYACVTKPALQLLKVNGMQFKDLGTVAGTAQTNSYGYGNLIYRGLLFDQNAQTWAAFLNGENIAAGVVTP